MMTSRRTLLAAVPSALLSGCALAGTGNAIRLRARPGKGSGSAVGHGVRALGLRKNRDAQLYVPKSAAESSQPAPLLVYLHGAGGAEQQGINRLSGFADTLGFVLLSPASEGRTWDGIRDGYGPDVQALDEALARAFGVCNVDAKRVGVCGFSDGASYALGVGLANGDLFQSVMAFSPGFIPPPFQPSATRPRVFISHGTNDQILPIETCSRRLVPELKGDGYRVTYREFMGPHTVPKEITEEALQWFLG
jgi:phospholipase/carboxylesterase